MKAVKGVKCGFDKKTSRITTVLSQPNRVVEQYGALREIIKQRLQRIRFRQQTRARSKRLRK